MNKELANLNSWNESEIINRTEILVKEALIYSPHMRSRYPNNNSIFSPLKIPMAITRWLSKLKYGYRCIEGAAVQAYRNSGIGIAPGLNIKNVVTDARQYQVK